MTLGGDRAAYSEYDCAPNNPRDVAYVDTRVWPTRPSHRRQRVGQPSGGRPRVPTDDHWSRRRAVMCHIFGVSRRGVDQWSFVGRLAMG